MTRLQIIVIFVLIFLAVEILLKLFGIINLSSDGIFGYAFFIYGISSVSISFGKNHKGVLFIGSLIFSIGFILLIISNFEILNTNSIVLPSTLFVLAVGFLILFFDDLKNKSFLTLSSIFFVVSIFTAVYNSSFVFWKFLSSIENIAVKFLPIEVLVLAGILVYTIIRKD